MLLELYIAAAFIIFNIVIQLTVQPVWQAHQRVERHSPVSSTVTSLNHNFIAITTIPTAKTLPMVLYPSHSQGRAVVAFIPTTIW
jgi:hypothetical protein